MNCQDLNLVIGLCSSVEHQIIGAILGWNDLSECFEQQLKLHYDKKEVDFMIEHKNLCNRELFWLKVILTDALLSQKKIKQSWQCISQNKSLTLELLLKYKEHLKGYYLNFVYNLNIPWSAINDITKAENYIPQMIVSHRTDIPEEVVKDNFITFKKYDCFSSICSEAFWKKHIIEWAPTSELQESQAEIIIKLKPDIKLYRSKFMSDEFIKKYKDNIDETLYDKYKKVIIYLDENTEFMNLDDKQKKRFVNEHILYISEHDLELHYAHITDFRNLLDNPFISEHFIERHISDFEGINDDLDEVEFDDVIFPDFSGDFFLKHLALSTCGQKIILKHAYHIPLEQIRMFMSYLDVRGYFVLKK
ncbi:Uncharacterised protein [uncultured archaeon]|nr:Uncharacterised protein [uncultured archaeon]